MLRQAIKGMTSLQRCVLSQARRNLGLSAVVAQKLPQLDPIQGLFVKKVKDYAEKSKAAGGKLVDATPEQELRFKSEQERIDRMFNATGRDMTKFPKFDFTDPSLEAVGIESAELGMKEAGDSPAIAVEEEAAVISPEIPFNY